MNVYDKFHPVTVKLLDKFGIASTLTRSTAQAAPTAAAKFDPAARNPHPTLTTIETIAVVPDPETTTDDAGREITYQVAIMRDAPVRGDILTIGDFAYLVGDVTATAPQGKAIYYTAVVRS